MNRRTRSRKCPLWILSVETPREYRYENWTKRRMDALRHIFLYSVVFRFSYHIVNSDVRVCLNKRKALATFKVLL